MLEFITFKHGDKMIIDFYFKLRKKVVISFSFTIQTIQTNQFLLGNLGKRTTVFLDKHEKNIDIMSCFIRVE